MSKTPPEPAEPPALHSDPPDTIEGPTAALPSEGADAPQHIGDFTVVRVLGEGGMGTVYLAEEGRLGRKAAIKTMKPELAARPENRARFVREARAAAAVEHDNIVPIWQVGEAADGSPYIAMPFLQGEMLQARLEREPVQPLGILLKVALEIAEGLAAAHTRGLIHRDIKPGNVWLEGDPTARDLARQVRRCKVLDFGLARSSETDDLHLTASGAILGTPAYMAPEQARGETVGPRADLFSLGVMLYRMATGRLPFAGPNAMAVLTALATVAPPPARDLNPNLPPALSDLIARLMCKHAARRPQSAAEVAAAVRQIAKELQARKSAPLAVPVAPGAPAPVASPWEDITLPAPEPAPVPAAKPGRGRTALLVALGLLVLLPLGWWLATVLLRVETANGTLVVEINDAEVEARIKGGKLILTGPDGKVRYTLSPSERNKKIDAGPYRIRVEGTDGLVLDTPEFTLKKGGKVTVRVTMAKRQGPARKAADMQAWLQRVAGLPAEKQVPAFKAKMKELNPDFDGQVTPKIEDGVVTELRFVTDKVTDIAPVRAFNALRVLDCSGTHTNWIRGNGQLADLTPLKGMNLAGLTQLGLDYTKVGDAGLAYFEDCKNLTLLGLNDTKVSDAGLAYFKACKNLTNLNLSFTQVGDKGLAHFKGRKNLTLLGLSDTKVSDAGLAYFKDCKNLTSLGLNHTQVSDAGLAHFKDCKNLTNLNLWGTQVGDKGLAHFKDCKNLTYLMLSNTKVGDAGLAHFKDCKNLTLLDLRGTQVRDLSPLKGMALKEFSCDFQPERDTEVLRSIKTLERINGKPAAEFWKAVEARQAGMQAWLKRVAGLPAQKQVAELKAKMKELNPDFDGQVTPKIEDGVVTELAFVTDKVTDIAPVRAFNALRILDCSGTHTNWRGNGQLADLTPLKGMNLAGLTSLNLGYTKVGDADLAHFKGCKNLTHLRLEGTKVGDTGLAHFKDCKNLTFLNLHSTQVSDAGLAHFKHCKNLAVLQLNYTKVGDAGLAHFKDCKSLTLLGLYNTQVSDAGLAYFKDCKDLTVLGLNGTKVGDTGLAHFKDCKNLTWLALQQTKVTRAKIEELKKALPKCKIEWDER